MAAAIHQTVSPLAPPQAALGAPAWLRLGKWFRLGIQLLTLAMVLAPAWWPHVLTGSPIYQGNFAASRIVLGTWALPMADPFTSLCVFLSSRAIPWSMAGGALLVAVIYGLVRARSFCAYACLIHLVLESWDRVLLRFAPTSAAIGSRHSPYSNVAVAALLLVGAAVVGLSLYEPVNPVNTLVRSLQHMAFAGLWLVVITMAVDALLGRRLFCRHVCPIGAFYGAANRCGFAAVAVDPGTCTGCQQCTVSCLAAPELTATIALARLPGRKSPVAVESPHCSLCLDCAARCERNGIVLRNRWRERGKPADGIVDC